MKVHERFRLQLRKFGDNALEPSILTLEVIKDAADAINVPILKGAAGILLTILKTVEGVKANSEACKMLAERAGEIVLSFDTRMKGIAITSQIKADVKKLEGILNGIKEFVDKQVHVHTLSRMIHGNAILGEISMHNKLLDNAFQLFQFENGVALRVQAEQDSSVLRRIEQCIGVENKDNSAQELEGIPVLAREEIELDEEMHKGQGYRLHTASYRNKVVIAKVFDKPRANRDWVFSAKFTHSLWHPNILRMIGVTFSSVGLDAFFFGANQKCLKSTERFMASALRLELERSVKLGIRLIHDLATGLDYLCSRGLYLSSIGLENFDVFIGTDDKIMINFNVDSMHGDFTSSHSNSSSLQMRIRDDEDWEIFNSLCRNTLQAANNMLYKECIKREAYRELPPTSEGLQNEKNLITSEAVREQLPGQAPRREFVWLAQNRGTTSLAAVSSLFADFMGVFSCSTADFRRIIACNKPTEHNCPGYRREEITLTTSIRDNAIVYHTTPAAGEICVVCGRIVNALPSDFPPLSQRIYDCTECNARFDRRGALFLHMLSHSIGPYRCEICFKKFESVGDRDRHQCIHHEEPQISPNGQHSTATEQELTCEYIPLECQSSVKSAPRGTLSEKAETAISAPTTRNFLNRQTFYSNRQKTHMLEKPFKCEICPNRYLVAKNRDRHQRTHGKDFFQSTNILQPVNKPKRAIRSSLSNV